MLKIALFEQNQNLLTAHKNGHKTLELNNLKNDIKIKLHTTPYKQNC